MKVSESILNNIRPLQVRETVDEILDLMEELKFSELPLVDEKGLYLGLVAEDDLLEQDGSQRALTDFPHFLKSYSITEDSNLFEAWRIIGQANLSLLPVVSVAGAYLGYLSPLEMIQDIGRQFTFTEAGSVLVMEVPTRDYSLAHIAQIVESEQARIIGFHLRADESGETFHLALKINQTDLSRILKSLDRYNYRVLMVFHQSIFDDGMSDRYEAFMKYLSI